MISLRTILTSTMSLSALMLLACSPGQGPQSPQPSPTIPSTPTPAATLLVSGSPPVATASVATPTTAAASPSASAVAVPPAAYLGYGSTEVEGELRTYCWLGTCVDSFELPPMADLPPLALGSLSTGMDLRLAGDAPFINWQASYGDGAMADLMPLDSGGEEYDPDATASLPSMLAQATVAAPPSGAWIVYVVVRGVEGDAHHAWRVSVP